MKKSDYILLGLIVVLIAYIVFTPVKVEYVEDTSTIDSLEIRYQDIVYQLEEVRDSIDVLKLELGVKKTNEIVIYETYIDSVDHVLFLSDDEQIELRTRLLSEENSIGW